MFELLLNLKIYIDFIKQSYNQLLSLQNALIKYTLPSETLPAPIPTQQQHQQDLQRFREKILLFY